MVNSQHWRVPLNTPDAKATEAADTALKTCLLDAKRFGSTSILLVPGVVNEKLPYDEVARRMEMPAGSLGPTRARCLGKLRKLVEAP